jgi:dipeptidyl aminopeptidase/acylaminoacyl peptidase
MRSRLGSALTIAAMLTYCSGGAARAADAPAAPALKPFTLEAAREIAYVSEPSISPDAKRIVYVRARADYKSDKLTAELVLVDASGANARVLTHDRESVSSPQWSPEGDRIAFLASPAEGKPPQIFVLPMDGGDALQATKNAAGVESFVWKPDGTQIAYAAPDEAPDAKAIAKHHDLITIGDDSYLTRSASQPTHLWMTGSDGSSPTQLTHGTASVKGDSKLHFSPDGKTLIYIQQPDATFAHSTKSRAIALDLTTKSERPLLASPIVTFAAFSRDGTKLAYVAPRHGSVYLQNDAYVVRAGDGSPVADTLAIDRNAKWTDVFPDGSLGFGATDGVRDMLWLVPPSGKAQRVDLGDVDFGDDGSIANDGTLAFVGKTRSRPNEIYVLPSGGGAPHRVSDDNAFASGYAIGRTERIDWKTDDGFTACGVLTYPPDYVPGKTYPLVLRIHGGPVSASTSSFNPNSQVFASRGIIVFNPNYRGSDDLGDAYLQAIVGHPTSGPGRDNLAGLAAVEKLGIVDTARVGVSGWSGGGLQTSWLIGHSHVWKAAVSGAAVNDWYEQALLADINEEFADVFFGGATPWTKDGRALYASESPITYASAITTPLLILSDTSDQRVPVTQSYALFHALRDRGQRVRFVAFPRYGHFPSDPVGSEAVERVWIDYLTTELKA